MSVTIRFWTPPLFALLAVFAVGCGGAKPVPPRQHVHLQEIHEIYQLFSKNKQRPPRQLSDLTRREYAGIYPAPVRALQEGKLVVVWGVKSTDPGTVLAYEKDVPTQGGAAVMADGTIKEMTAEEFKAANKS